MGYLFLEFCPSAKARFVRHAAALHDEIDDEKDGDEDRRCLLYSDFLETCVHP